jgi:pimeloyl-ACP methyl ester carboxylesterase
MVSAISTGFDTLDEQKLRFVDAGGVRVRCYEDGTGEPLVLLSGGEYGALYSLDAWSLNFKQLSQHFRIYAIDKPGQGYSDIPKRDADYTFEWLFDSIHALSQVLGIRQAHWVGHSRGALLVARFALKHPDLVKTAVIVDSSTLAPEDPHVPTDLFYEEIGMRTPPGPPTPETVRMEADAQSFSRAHISADYVRRMLEIASLSTMQEARRRMREVRLKVWHPSLYRNRTEILRQIEDRGLPMPTLIVWGFNDRAAPLYLGHRLFERICPKTPDAEFHVLNQAGHYSFREQWQKFNRVVSDFCLR